MILIVGGPAGAASGLHDRLVELGFRCAESDDPPAEVPEGPAVILLLPEPGDALPRLAPRAEREGTSLGGVPVLLLGRAPLDDAIGLDECLPEEASDAVLAARLSTWALWSAKARPDGRSARDGSGRTSLPGHTEFIERLRAEMQRHERYNAPLGLVLADISGLREINSRYGHRTGDRVIREVGETLLGAVRGTDCVFHYGGDTFAILLTHSAPEATERAVARLRTFVAGRLFRGDPEGAGPAPLLKISMNFGQAALPAAGIHEPDDMVAAAESSLADARLIRPQGTIPAGHS